MKKICFVAGHVHHHTGGAEVQAIRIAAELRQRGFEVCYLNNPIVNTRDFPEEEEIDGIRVFNSHCRRRLRIFDYWKIRRLLKRIGADRYYLRASPFHEGFVTRLANRQGMKAVWQCASGRSMVKFYKFRELLRSGRPLTILANGFNYLTEDLLRLYAIRNAGGLIAQSEAIRATLQQRFDRRSELVLKGIRVPESLPAKDGETLNVLFLRTIRGYSRHERFLDVARSMKQDPRIRFSIAGRLARSKQGFLDSLEEYNVSYLGFLPNEEALRVLEKTDILVDTLDEPEGLTAYNTSFLEAWSRGVAILSFGSNPDNVLGRFNVGYKVNSVSECVDRIRHLDCHRDVLQRMGVDAHAYVRDHHDIDDEIDRLLEALA